MPFKQAEARRPAIGLSTAGIAGSAVAAAASLLLAMPAYSASVSYILNQSNTLADGVDYLKVTLSDGASGSVDFKVEILPALSSQSTGNLAIQQFAFNVVGGTDTEAWNVKSLPIGWHASNGGRMDGFGLFDLTVQGKGQSELDFSIKGVSLDTLLSYVDPSRGNAPDGHVDFAAKVSGLTDSSNSDTSSSNRAGRTIQSVGSNGRSDHNSILNIINTNCDTGGQGGSGGNHWGDGGGSSQGSGGDGGHRGGSAYFGGPGPVVPVPPAVWLFGSALALMGSVRRRLHSTAA